MLQKSLLNRERGLIVPTQYMKCVGDAFRFFDDISLYNIHHLLCQIGIQIGSSVANVFDKRILQTHALALSDDFNIITVDYNFITQ